MATNKGQGRSSKNARRTSHASSSSNRSHGTMTKEEAGRMGGLAPHSCRGSECSKKSSSRSSKKRYD